MDAQGGESDPICFNANIVNNNNEPVATNPPNVHHADNATLLASITAPDRTATDNGNHPDVEITSPVDFGDIEGQPVKIEGQDNLENAGSDEYVPTT